jgi:N-acyl-D-amino-acid deacylase
VPGHYARDLGLLTTTEAVRKTTGPPAARFGQAGRGVMRDGAPADLVVFDPSTVWIRLLTTNPLAGPTGIRL